MLVVITIFIANTTKYIINHAFLLTRLGCSPNIFLNLLSDPPVAKVADFGIMTSPLATREMRLMMTV